MVSRGSGVSSGTSFLSAAERSVGEYTSTFAFILRPCSLASGLAPASVLADTETAATQEKRPR